MKHALLKLITSSLLFVAVLTLALLEASAATIWYVAPTGSDTNAGTLALPFKTITKAHQAASAGDTINVRAGTYRESITVAKPNLTIQSYPGETATIKGSDIVTGWTQETGKNVWSKNVNVNTGTILHRRVPGLPTQCAALPLFLSGLCG